MNDRLICVPITETDRERFLAAVREADVQADAIELRIDYLAEADHAILLKQLRAWRANGNITKPLILTHRPKEQGGQRELAFDERVNFWQSFDAWDLLAYAAVL